MKERHDMTNATTTRATEIQLGAVYTIGTGRRRYLAINRALFGRWDLMALSGGFRGCQPSSVDADDMKLAKDQTVAFGGVARESRSGSHGTISRLS